MEELIYKNFSEISQIDEGIIDGYANVYNVKDSQGDISLNGSFAKTVTERKTKIRIFKNHNDQQLIGVPMDMDISDPYGLKIRIKMLMETDLGRNAFQEIKFLKDNGFESGLSIGGWIVKRNPKNKSEIQEYKLKEVSLLTNSEPANEFSLVSAVKSIKELTEPTQAEFWSVIEKAYNERFSDKILLSLEQFQTLKDSEPSDLSDFTPDVIQPSIIQSIYSKYI